MIATAPLLERALAYAYGELTVQDVELAIGEGRMQAWDGQKSLVVTELKRGPQHLTLHFLLAAGTLAELRHMAPYILQWGREQGCTRATLCGRFGWLRSFVRELGFVETATMMGMEL